MYYKEDWESARKRLELFWNEGEITDRPCVAVFAPRKTSRLPSFPELQWGPWLGGLETLADDDEKTIREWWVDPEQNYARMQTWFENTWFGGEAIPCTYVNWGAMAMASFYGSPAVFKKTSVWYPEVIRDWDEWKWDFDRAKNKYWLQTLDIVKLLLERNKGRYFIGTPELGTAGDLLSLMRGMDNLALDILDRPEEIKRAISLLGDTNVELSEQVYHMTYEANDKGGVLAWMSLWSPGRQSQLACDFSTVISPDLFKEFFIGEIEKEAAWGDYATYHLDGPDALRSHLDTLLAIPSINTIEWTPGAGSPPTYTPEYLPAYRKIQQAGKRLYLLAEPEEIEPLMAELSPKRLFLCTHADSQEEGESLLEKIAGWTRNMPT
ncbi:MAG: hypothetical protein WCQ50_03560 [Spirochaetota bacterium]